MDVAYLMLMLLFFLFLKAEAQAATLATDSGTDASVTTTSFQPSLAVVIGVLFLMFTITFILIIYAKFCHRTAAAVHVPSETLPGLVRSGSRYSGLDKTVIESLPFFRFSSLKGSKEGLECAVCLSKFEDIEILRLLPQCKHAFHIQCVDRWLESHSSCPLCRCKVSPEDPAIFTYTNSMRFFGSNRSAPRTDSNIELFVQREENHQGSSRFSVGGSFRKADKSCNVEEQSLMKQTDSDNEFLNKYNHKIIVSDVVFKNRWSNVSSSDLMFLNSELLNDMSSNRFCGSDVKYGSVSRGIGEQQERDHIVRLKEEMEIKRMFENKVSSMIDINSNNVTTPSGLPSTSAAGHTLRSINSEGRRSVSEISGLRRSRNLNTVGVRSTTNGESNVKEERLRRIWLAIAKGTVEWFVKRETTRSSHRHSQTQTSVERLDA